MDPTRRFTETVEAYVRFRPDYPAALFERLTSLVPGRDAVDLGAGTGIFSRQLAAAGFRVVAVEPNAAMRAAASGAGGPPVVDGRAERTGLPSACADLIVGAQAFHWFELDLALPEVARLARPGAVAAAVWNDRATDGFAGDWEELVSAFSRTYRDVPKPGPTLAELRRRCPRGVEEVLPHAQTLDLPSALGRAWSSSYVVHGVDDREGFDAALTEAFHRRAVDGRATLTYLTRLFWWSPGAPLRPGA